MKTPAPVFEIILHANAEQMAAIVIDYSHILHTVMPRKDDTDAAPVPARLRTYLRPKAAHHGVLKLREKQPKLSSRSELLGQQLAIKLFAGRDHLPRSTFTEALGKELAAAGLKATGASSLVTLLIRHKVLDIIPPEGK